MEIIDDFFDEVNIDTPATLDFEPVYDADGYEVGLVATNQKHYGKFAKVPMELFYEGRHLSLEAKWVYATLVSFKNNKTGKTFPSYEAIMKRSGITRRQTIADALKELEHFNWIIRRKKVGKSNSYFVGECPVERTTDAFALNFRPLRPTQAEAESWKASKRRQNDKWSEYVMPKEEVVNDATPF